MFKVVTILFFHNAHNYAINLFFEKIFFYEPLYNMFQKKLKILQKYIDNNFAKNRIRHSITNIKALMLFVFKNNEKFRLCVNYKNFNIITIKNKVFFY